MTATTPTRSDELQGHVAMLLFACFVAGSFSFGGRIANDIDPAALTAARFALTTLALGGAAWGVGQLNRQMFRAPWRYLILGALYGGYFVLMFEGLKTATPVSMAAVFTLTPVLAAGCGYLVLRQVTTASMGFALAIGALGAMWVIFRGDLASALAMQVGRGELIFLAGCFLHALYIPLVPKLSRGEGLLAFATGSTLGGMVIVGAYGAPAIAETDWAALSPQVWATLIYLVIFASAMSITLVQFASRRLKAAKVMAYTYLVPSVVILWELVLTGSLPPVIVLGGVALTIAALVLLLREDPSSA